MSEPGHQHRGGIRASFAQWTGACAGAVLAIAALAAARPPRCSASPPTLPSVSLSKAVGSPLRITWRARVETGDAEFRIYRGQDANHLERVATLPADRGEGDYRYLERSGNTDDAVYEVRVTDREGSEHLVARARCLRTQNLQGGARHEAPPQPLAIVATVVDQAFSSLAIPVRASNSRDNFGFRQQPPVPPPRHGSRAPHNAIFLAWRWTRNFNSEA